MAEENMMRCVCYTLWNYTYDDIEHLKSYSNVYFHVCAEEEGTETEKKHLQGYIELKTRKRFKRLQFELTKNQSICQGIHLEPRRDSQREAIDYIMDPLPPKKRGNLVILKGIPRRTEETSWEDYCKDLILKHNISSVGQLYTDGSVELDKRLVNAFEKAEEYLGKSQKYPVSLTWIYYSPQVPVGLKDDCVEAFLREFGSSYYRVPCVERYFQGYSDQKVILWDNFHTIIPSDVCDNASSISDLAIARKEIYNLLMCLTSSVTTRYNKKWGSVHIKPEHVVVVSAIPPWYIFNYLEGGTVPPYDVVPPLDAYLHNIYLLELMTRINTRLFVVDDELRSVRRKQGPWNPSSQQDKAKSNLNADNAPKVGPDDTSGFSFFKRRN